MKLTDFATEIYEINRRLQTLIHIKEKLPNLQTEGLIVLQKEVEQIFNDLYRQWKKAKMTPSLTLNEHGLILKD